MIIVDFNSKNHIFIFIVLGSLFGLFLGFFLLTEMAENPRYFIYYVILVLFLRFPHELAHYGIAKIMGIPCCIKFARINATCTPLVEMSSFQVIVIAAAPLLILGAILAIGIGHKLILAVFLSHILTCYGDLCYIVAALRYRRGKFKCEGLKLKLVN